MRTLGSETSQYQEEKKPIGISLVAASERESAQTVEFLRQLEQSRGLRNSRGHKAVISHSMGKKLQIVVIAEVAGKQRPRR